MNYEKMYKEALKKAKDGKPIEEIFPELTTNERIIKEIRGFLCWANERGSITNYQFKSWTSWLEKQDDQTFKEALRTEYEKGRADVIAEIYNHTWSEEDEKNLIDAIKYLELFDAQGIHGNVVVPVINWLKSFKEKYMSE